MDEFARSRAETGPIDTGLTTSRQKEKTLFQAIPNCEIVVTTMRPVSVHCAFKHDVKPYVAGSASRLKFLCNEVKP